MNPVLPFCRAVVLLLATSSVVEAAGLFQCTTAAGVVSYADTPCSGILSESVAVDRPTVQEAQPRLEDRAVTARRPPHRLTAAERERLLRLRQAQPKLPAEAARAAEIEIAALREGADALLTPDERATRERLRAALGASDAATRRAALAAWQELYAAHREPARPRSPPAPPGLGEPPLAREPYPSPPPGQPAPGTRGPLAASAGAPVLPPPSSLVRPGPAVDPITGRVLAPAGDRLVDPLTGTVWLRSGRSYVDPLTGHTIPAP